MDFKQTRNRTGSIFCSLSGNLKRAGILKYGSHASLQVALFSQTSRQLIRKSFTIYFLRI